MRDMSKSDTMDEIGTTEKIKLSNSAGSGEYDTTIDFTIKVGEKSFNVDRETIITHSEYFRAMLAHDTVENQQGFVDMKDVDPDVIGECIEFMKTGRMIEINMDNVGDVLNAAGIMQLDKITETCVEFLKGNLNPENCIIIFEIITKYSITGLQERVQTLFNETYKINTLTGFVQLSESNFIKHLQQHKFSANIVAWEALMRWIYHNDRQECLSDLMISLNWKTFPSTNFLERVWSETIFVKSQKCVELLCENVFMDIEAFEKNISAENYFTLKMMTEKFRFIPKQIKNSITEFLKNNVIKLLGKPEFKAFGKKKLVSLLIDTSIDDITGERWKWWAIKSWVEFESERINYLPELLYCVRLDHLSRAFVKMMGEDTLFNNLPECRSRLWNAMLRENTKIRKRHFIAVKYSNGRICAMDVMNKDWKEIRDISADCNSQIFSFNGRLCYGTKNNQFYLNRNNKWIKIHSWIGERGDNQIEILLDYLSSFGPMAMNEFTYSTSDKVVTRFDMVNKVREDMPPAPVGGFLFGTSVGQYLYCVTRESIVQRFDLLESTRGSVSQLPSGYYSDNKLLSIDKSLFAIHKNSEIYVYDKFCKKLNKLCDVLKQFSSSGQEIFAQSICTFYKD